MKRKIITIDKEKCNGCGACADACHEGAIGMIEGKAQLLRDDYCDGLGDCLPVCPTNAISFEEREALAYDDEAVKKAKEEKIKKAGSGIRILQSNSCSGGCPGSKMKEIKPATTETASYSSSFIEVSQLQNWPVQIKLAPIQAPYFQNANLLVAADCTAFSYASFHKEILKGKVALIGCPKLDSTDYSEKLTEIISNNDIKSLTVVRMEVPCCGGIEIAAKKALQNSGKFIPWQIITISIDGKILE